MRNRWLGLVLASAAFCLVIPAADAQVPLNTTNSYLRAKAQPDECWFGIGQNFPFLAPPCLFSTPKVNQAYVWAMTQSPNKIWFGTVANPQCITQSGLFPPDSLIPYATESWACEFDKSPYVPTFLPGIIGDFRPSQMYIYDKTTKALTNITPTAPITPGNPTGIDPLILTTRGIRAATTIGNLVLFAGPSLLTGINFFAYRADTNEYLGSGTLPNFTNIRQMVVENGVLYIPVGANNIGGEVLRWTGSITPFPCASCFQFQTVGLLDGIGSYITVHENRLYVTTWPNGLPTSLSAVFQSPVLPPGGLTPANAGQWRKIWDASQYEPDRVIAASYAGGAVASFDGYLYWGTMHVPWFGTALALGAYPTPTTDAQWAEFVVNTFRTATIFRARDLSNVTPDIQLLYGLPALPAWNLFQSKWDVVNNKMPANRRDPLYGFPGFNNPYNNYTWAMSVWDNRLWVGTMDWSHPAEQGTKALFNGQPIPAEITTFFALQNFGGDLHFFQNSISPAVPESTNGLNNYTSYGVRNLLPSGNLFVGIANASNLLGTGLGPKGGWELIELEKKPGQGPLNLLTGFTCAPGVVTGVGSKQCTVTIGQPSNGLGVTVGVLPLLFDGEVTAPQLVNIPIGMTSATFTVQFTEPSKPATAYLIAGLNGGSMVAPVQIAPGVPRITGIIVGKGVVSPGVQYQDVRISNTGTGAATNVTIDSLAVRVLAGTGAVTVASGPGLTPPMPIILGPIPIGDARVVRLYFNVPATVTRFSLTENGTATNRANTAYKYSISQSIIP